MRFEGKVVIITGAGQGLGAAYARDFAQEGASVVLAGRTFSKVEAVAEGIRKDGGNALALECDVGDYPSVKACVAETVRRFGGVDILINNAAISQAYPVWETSPESFDIQMKTNLYGTFYFCREVVPHMMEKKYGKIININSSAAKHFFPGLGAYAASKGGVASFSSVLSEEVKHHNINVNTLYLGLISSDNIKNRAGKDPLVSTGLDEMMTPEEVSKVVMFIASDDGAPFVGAGIDIFGKKY